MLYIVHPRAVLIEQDMYVKHIFPQKRLVAEASYSRYGQFPKPILKQWETVLLFKLTVTLTVFLLTVTVT